MTDAKEVSSRDGDRIGVFGSENAQRIQAIYKYLDSNALNGQSLHLHASSSNEKGSSLIDIVTCFLYSKTSSSIRELDE